MTDQSFIDYVSATERLLEDHYALTLTDAGIELHELARAQEDGWTPVVFVDWFARKYDLEPVDVWQPAHPTSD